MQEKLACSESTVRRTLNTLRDMLCAPIIYDRERNGYYYDQQKDAYELPGLWFNAEELYALLISHNLLEALQPGVLNAHIKPLKQRIENLLQHQHAGSPELANRIRILQTAARPTQMDHFRQVSSALIKRKRMRVLYHGRERDATTERILSPQRLIYYRSNWYLDAWCHLRRALRSFSLDRLNPIETLARDAKEINSHILDDHYTNAYGIFAGEPKHTATLLFTPAAARWVADEQWHPQQQGKVLKDGAYELRIPYSDPRELVMDILKYGDDVKVIAPETLREQVTEKLSRALNNYK